MVITGNNEKEDMNGNYGVSWVILKEQAKAAFERGDYQAAIQKYTTALLPEKECPSQERQILLSNLVAARLRLGGPAQAEAAVENARQCVAINDRWAKGHVRLASAYIALGGSSNDACNALQRALQLDPGYPNVRQMLIRELRREQHDRAGKTAGESTSGSNADSSDGDSQPQPTAPPEEYDNREYFRFSSSSSSAPASATAPDRQESAERQDNTQTQAPTRAPNDPYRDQAPPAGGLDDSISLWDRISFFFHRARQWYFSQSEDLRTAFMVLIGLVLLYVAFGGRFGLDSLIGHGNKPRRGNYRSGNVYEQYRKGQRRTSQRETSGRNRYSAYDHHEGNNRHHGSSHHDGFGNNHGYGNGNHYHAQQGEATNARNFFQMPNLFDGSLQSILILGGIWYLCQRNGINPMQILFFLNMMNGGRRRHAGGMFRYGGGGLGGFGRRRW